ncbi:MAG: von Willebrand factor, type [Thermomicrobiales bacterium]|nr:von Willebrand factor, type [Thermomicrobiales bacterium]
MRSLTCSPGWVQRAFNLLLLLVLTTTSAGLLGLVSPRSTAAAPAKQDEQAVRTVNLELILDLSGSMARDIGGGETRMEAAKRVMNDVIDALPEREGVNVGFRIYGHLGNNTEAGRDVSCQSSELVVPIQGVNKPALRDQVAAAEPIGWTPIALSLQRAGGDFQPGEGVANHILLVTDGEETCGGDPCAVAESLREGEARLTTHVVGFALNEEQARLVSCIAERGGGLNLRAGSARELSNAIFSVLEEIQVVVQNGFLEIEEIGGLFPRATITFVATGDQTPRDAITLTTDNRVELAVGFYDVSWTYATGGEISIRVNIEAGRTTWIRGSLLKFPQGAGEIYVVKDLAGTVIWQAPFEEGDYLWVLPGIYTMDLVERVGDPVLIMAQVQTLPGSETQLEVFTAP